MKLLTRFAGSSAIVIGLVGLLTGGSNFFIKTIAVSQEASHEKTVVAVKKTMSLQLALEKQTSILKNFFLLKHDPAILAEYERAMSNFLLQLDELKQLIPDATEINVVRDRHQLLTRLVNELKDNTQFKEVQNQQDIKAINSFSNDISLYLDILATNTQEKYQQDQQEAEKFTRIADVVVYVTICLILLTFFGQFTLVLIPVLKSIKNLQLGAAKIGSGELNYYLDIHTGDEIEKLSQEFNQMSAKLSEFYLCLEEKVMKRTSELAEVNQTLKSEISERQQVQIKLQDTIKELQETQIQLIQTEKMSSLGQLVAGVAHEINNPVSFIFGNINYVDQYTQDLLELLHLYQRHCVESNEIIEQKVEEIDLEFLAEDLPKTLSSMKMGANRISEIVRSLRNFSRLDEAEMKAVDIHEGIDSTLLILQSRLKLKSERPEIKIIKEYGNLPLVNCYAGQLNQVFMNIINNAIDALDEHDTKRSIEEIHDAPSTIIITTKMSSDHAIAVKIADNGSGIPETVKAKLFNPFFTTKPVGKGTGLGLSISYQIITEKHKGTIQCVSELGLGTEFWIEIPLS
jgi:signal transduction histidine kinase